MHGSGGGDGVERSPARVIVTPGVGRDVVRLTARLLDGTRPVEVVVDRQIVSDEEVVRLIRFMERVLRRYDPERRNLRLLR